MTFPKKYGIIKKKNADPRERTVQKMKYGKSPRGSGKKGILRLAALLLIPLLAACQSNTPADPLTDATSAEAPADPPKSGAEISVSSTSESTSESSAASTTESATESSAASTTEAAPTNDVVSTTDVVSEAPPELPENFRLSDYITDFDDVKFSYCTVLSDCVYPQADEADIALAIETYKSSELYTEAVDYLKEIFSYENGELICSAEYTGSDPVESLLAKEYIDARSYFIDRSAAPEIALKPEVIQSCRAPFDGENEESLVLLRTALPMSKQDWSGNFRYHVAVYINADGEAQILYDACRQDHGGFELLNYGPFVPQHHALFSFGHNQSGQRSVLYSFRDGKPKIELSGCPFIVRDGLLLGGYGWGFWEPYLFDRENGALFVAAAVTPSEELAEIICSDPTVLSYVPDTWEFYRKDRLQIVGGKYITFCTGIPWVNNTFVYNQTVKRFERVDQPVSTWEVRCPDQFTESYHVDLESEPYSNTRF